MTNNTPPGTHPDEQKTQQNGSLETATPSPSEEILKNLETKLKEQEQKYVYLYADFENYKKRAIKERQDMAKFGWENIAHELLQVLDNLERALQHTQPNTDPQLLSGLKMVLQQFKITLEKNGITEIATENQVFNPELHEGVGQVPSDKAEGAIVQENQKGYTLHGRLLRPSRVLVSTGKATH